MQKFPVFLFYKKNKKKILVFYYIDYFKVITNLQKKLLDFKANEWSSQWKSSNQLNILEVC